jgi:hypothetical protein
VIRTPRARASQRLPRLHLVRLTISALIAVLVLAFAPAAVAAETAPKISFESFVGEGHRWLVAATAGPTAASDPTSRTSSATAERVSPDRPLPAEQTPFVDFSPHASVVARDWRGSMKLVGDRAMLVDTLRPTASHRMIMGRIATDATLTLFAQAGAGEWRVDTVMFPSARSYSELAAQVGGGFELRVNSRVRVGGEVQYTMLSRNLTYTTDEVAPRIASFVLAIDSKF